MTWREHAACVGDWHTFYSDAPTGRPPGRDRGVSANQRHALAICQRCPVTTQCLAAALEHESNVAERRHGIWGGMTPRQRDEIARTR